LISPGTHHPLHVVGSESVCHGQAIPVADEDVPGCHLNSKVVVGQTVEISSTTDRAPNGCGCRGGHSKNCFQQCPVGGMIDLGTVVKTGGWILDTRGVLSHPMCH
jgi:hypothetical protein